MTRDIRKTIPSKADGSAADIATQTTLAAALSQLQAIASELAGVLSANVAVVNFPATQPVSAASLPLPTGAATEATLAAAKADLDKLPADPAREGGNLATLAGKDFATQATLALIKAKTDNLDAALSTLATQATLALVKAKTDNLDLAMTALRDAIVKTGATSKTLADLDADLAAFTKAQAASFAQGDKGVPHLAVQKTWPPAAQAGAADGKYVALQLNELGQLWITGARETGRRTYSAAVRGIVPAASATDIFAIKGSDTATIRVLKIVIMGTATAAGMADILGIKRSTANTGGTSATATNVPYDSNDAAATATVQSWTANPTLGTAVGNIRANKYIMPAATNPTIIAPELSWKFEHGKPLYLRGSNEQLAVNLNGQTITGGSYNIAVEWEEL